MKLAALAALAALAVSACPPADVVSERDLRRFLFFAVLEGLMEDGVPDATVDRILEQKDGRYVNFVYACPICHPVIEGCRAFRMRGEFIYGTKGDPYVGKSSLPAELAALLADKDPLRFREGLEKLVSRNVERRMKLLRFSAGEAKHWNTALADARRKGGEMFKSGANPESDLPKCPSCEGAYGARLR